MARQLGVPYCKVSVPMTESEVIAHAKTDGNPNPEGTDWADLVSKIQPGDQLRLVNCFGAARSRKISDKYYYGLFRGNSVIAKFHSMIYD